MTVEEFWHFCLLPENHKRLLELSSGQVIAWPPPYLRHGVVAANTAFALHDYAEETRSGYVTTGGVGLILSREPGTVRGPDVAFFPIDVPVDPKETMWDDALPLLAVEVQSGNDPADQVRAKIADLVGSDIPEVWLVEPDGRTLTAYRHGVEPRTYTSADVITTDTMPGFTLPVVDLFRLRSQKVPG